jgi:hypothetical protein
VISVRTVLGQNRSLFLIFPAHSDLGRIPKNTTFVGELESFLPIAEGTPIQSGRIELKNGIVRYFQPALSSVADDILADHIGDR